MPYHLRDDEAFFYTYFTFDCGNGVPEEGEC